MKRLVIVVAVCLLALSGCAQNQGGDEPAPVAGKGADEQSEQLKDGYRYTDILGREIAFEAVPVKVATTYMPLWEALLMLDIKPIAAGGAEQYIATWPPFQTLDLSGTEDIGSKDVNMEKLASLKPDLILHQARDLSNVDLAKYEAISKVAVFGNETKMDWRLSLREVGKLMNCLEKAERVIADVEQTLKEARESFETSYHDQTVVVLSMMAADHLVYAYRPEFYDKKTGLGLNTPEGFTEDTNFTGLSLETLVAMNPDYLFVNVFSGSEAQYEALGANPVWQSLKAVKAGQVYMITGAAHSPSPMSTVYTIEFMIDKLTE